MPEPTTPTPDEAEDLAAFARSLREHVTEARATTTRSASRAMTKRFDALDRMYVAGFLAGAGSVFDWLEQWADNLEHPHNTPHDRKEPR